MAREVVFDESRVVLGLRAGHSVFTGWDSHGYPKNCKTAPLGNSHPLLTSCKHVSLKFLQKEGKE